MTIAQLLIMFFAKVADNTLNTAKTILIQKNRCVLAGIVLGLSNFICLNITKNIVSSDSSLALVTVSAASGIGCCLAVALSNRFSKEKTYVNVIMSDNIAEMKKLRDFLAQHHIVNVATDSYTLDWNKKSIAITAYAETKSDSKLIDEFTNNSSCKFKRMVDILK